MRTIAALLFATVASAQTPATQVTASSAPAGVGLGVRARYITVPEFFLGMFTDESVALHSAAFGAEVSWRREPDFDWVFGVEYAFASPPDGNWLGNGKDPRTKTDFVHFDNFGFITIDATAVWRTQFTPVFALTYGAGLGAAIVTGSMTRASATGCNGDNLENTEECNPPSCGPDGCSAEELAAMRDTPVGPGDEVYDPEEPPFEAFEEEDIPPVLPVVHALVGLHITPHPSFEIRVDGGFHNAFFLGTALQYMF